MRKLLPYILLICALCWVAQAAVFMRGTPAPAAAAPGGENEVELSALMVRYLFDDGAAVSNGLCADGIGTNDAVQPTSGSRPAYSDSNDGVLTFDGNDDFLNLPNSLYITQDNSWSLEVWCKINTAVYLDGIWSEYHSQDRWALWIHSPTNLVGFYSYEAAGQRIAVNVNAEPLNTWKCIQVSFTTNDAKMYINGVQVGTGSGDMSAATNPPTYNSIGRYSNSKYFDGQIGEFRRWNKVVSSNDFLTSYGYRASRYGL